MNDPMLFPTFRLPASLKRAQRQALSMHRSRPEDSELMQLRVDLREAIAMVEVELRSAERLHNENARLMAMILGPVPAA